jgi:hypothetical protein
MFTYLSDEMHPKKVLAKKLFSEKIVPKMLFFGQNFFWVHFDTKVSGHFGNQLKNTNFFYVYSIPY